MGKMLFLMDVGGNDAIPVLFQEPMAVLPLWFIFVATVVIVLLSIEVGYRVGLARRKYLVGVAEKEPTGEIVAAVLGLLAFMLGFTFHLSASRYDARRALVTEEANAIGTTYLRAGMLQDPQRAEIRKLLREYVDIRLAAIQSGQVRQIIQGIKESEKLHTKLWHEAEAAAAKNPGSVPAGLFTYSLNEVIDLHEKRVTLGLKTHIPTSIWGTLYLIAICSMGILGYHGGLSDSHRLSTVIPLTLAFSIVILLINSLDRPMAGLIKVSQEPLAKLHSVWAAENPAR